MADTAAFSGLRWGELIALTVSQVDLAARVITVDRKVVEVAGHLFRCGMCSVLRRCSPGSSTPPTYPAWPDTPTTAPPSTCTLAPPPESSTVPEQPLNNRGLTPTSTTAFAMNARGLQASVGWQYAHPLDASAVLTLASNARCWASLSALLRRFFTDCGWRLRYGAQDPPICTLTGRRSPLPPCRAELVVLCQCLCREVGRRSLPLSAASAMPLLIGGIRTQASAAAG